MNEQVGTVIIGGGQAGLAMSYHLSQLGREHVILERGRLAESWRQRWDSLTLLTPNWLTQLPGFAYQGDHPDGFMPREQFIEILEGYAARFHAPLHGGTAVELLRQKPDRDRYLVQTSNGTLEAANVVIATGGFQKANVPPLSAGLPHDIVQLHSSAYQNPGLLPPGGVLVVGSGSSGCQICEELSESGRQVYFSLGRSPRGVRRYRGKDAAWWRFVSGDFDRTFEQMGPEMAKYGARGQQTGVRGGHDLDYRRFAADGVVLLGHLRGVDGPRVRFAPDLKETIRLWDEALLLFKHGIDAYIRSQRIDAPQDNPVPSPELDPRVTDDPTTELDLPSLGITTVIWATGFLSDFAWAQVPVFDGAGRPIHQRGITSCPGLYFLGLRFLYKFKSSFIFGVGDDAAYLAERLG